MDVWRIRNRESWGLTCFSGWLVFKYIWFVFLYSKTLEKKKDEKLGLGRTRGLSKYFFVVAAAACSFNGQFIKEDRNLVFRAAAYFEWSFSCLGRQGPVGVCGETLFQMTFGALCGLFTVRLYFDRCLGHNVLKENLRDKLLSLIAASTHITLKI